MRPLLLSALTLSLLLCACAPRPDNDGTSDAPATHPADTTTSETDTTAASGLPEDSMPPPPPGNTPAPGSARVQAMASSCEAGAEGAFYQCALRIEQIEAYGSSTPRIGKGRVLQARLSEQTLDLAASEARKALLEGAGSVELTLRHVGEAPAGSSDSPPEWEVARIH